MCDCNKLSEVNAKTIMPKLKTIGYKCFSYGKNNPPAKTTFNLSGFQNVETIGDNTFTRCNIDCEEFDFSVFQNVRTIGERFMSNCFKTSSAGKKTIDLSPLQKLETIGDYFLIKDVGFNYWSVGSAKVRGNSIGDRILYKGIRESDLDVAYVKGSNFNKYSKIDNAFIDVS